MSNATAKYILSAEDQTQSAINSAKRAFKELDDGVRTGAKSLKLMSELLVGGAIIAGFRRLTNAAIEASAANDKGFAASLTRVREAAHDLMAAKTGLPGATAAMNELADTLKDPSVVAAADVLTSALITGFAKVAKYTGQIVAGIGLIFNGPAQKSLQIDDRMLALQNEKSRTLSSFGVKDASELRNSHDLDATRARLAEIDKLLAEGSKEYNKALDDEAAASHAAAVAAKALADEHQRMIDVKVHGILAAFRLKETMKQVDDGGKWLEGPNALEGAQDALDKLRESNGSEVAKMINDGFEEVSKDAADQEERRLKNTRDNITELSEWAKEAARSTFNAFSDFFFDPFENGIKGLASGLIDAFRRALANKAAQDVMSLFSSFGSGGDREGKGGWIGTALGALFGGARAGGGPVAGGSSYLVGERGPELFTPRSSGSISPNSALGGTSVNIVQNIDARGATMDVIANLPGILKAHGEQVKADIIDGISRHRYSF